MKIGNENRPDWVMERHWVRMADDIRISPNVLKKYLAAFCTQLTDTIDTTVTGFIREFGENDLVQKADPFIYSVPLLSEGQILFRPRLQTPRSI